MVMMTQDGLDSKEAKMGGGETPKTFNNDRLVTERVVSLWLLLSSVLDEWLLYSLAIRTQIDGAGGQKESTVRKDGMEESEIL